jgi:anaerobic ribonucleoside-triphosphate reductase
MSKKGRVMDEIIKQIEKLKVEREQVKGTPCEVYSRVCGYLRPTQSWNKGKQEEFKQRKMIKVKIAQ